MSAAVPPPANPPPASIWRIGTEALDGPSRLGPTSDLDTPRAPRPRPGWYAYRVSGPARMPPWAVELALTIERPVEPAPSPNEGRLSGEVEALLLLRAPSRVRLLGAVAEATVGAVAEAAVEIEAAAGLRPAEPRARFLSGVPLPGLTPVSSAAAQAHLAVAEARGLPAPLRRRHPAAPSTQVSWRSSAGSVLTCEGPGGTSAQAVIRLRGLGDPAAIGPPPGCALVLRAWEGRRAWGLVCGLVLGAAETLGLGREAGRMAAAARAEGWDAAVLRGPTALHLARAGDPHRPPPQDIAYAAPSRQVHAAFEACLAGGGVERPGDGQSWVLAVTP